MSTFDDMIRFLDSAWVARDYVVPCMIGPVGIGKTDALHQHARNVGARNVVTIIVSQILPNEVSGITMPDGDTKSMEIYDHYKLGHLQDGDILFFDELLEGDQMVMSACLTLIESRMLMSGRKLPRIQIVAACNPTIQPNMLKPSIRQRFLFRKFDLDKKGSAEYLNRKFGIDATQLVQDLVENGDEYNFLSPRSLTKMIQWMNDTPEEKRLEVSNEIDCAWGSLIGTKIFNAFANLGVDPKKEQLRKGIIEAMSMVDVSNAKSNDDSHVNTEAASRIESDNGDTLGEIIVDREKFSETSMTDLMEMLTKLPDWSDIVAFLSSTEFQEEEEHDDILF